MFFTTIAVKGFFFFSARLIVDVTYFNIYRLVFSLRRTSLLFDSFIGGIINHYRILHEVGLVITQLSSKWRVASVRVMENKNLITIRL